MKNLKKWCIIVILGLMDARTDIYSLGILLRQLLTGSTQGDSIYFWELKRIFTKRSGSRAALNISFFLLMRWN